jgi:hypothetical protein
MVNVARMESLWRSICAATVPSAVWNQFPRVLRCSKRRGGGGSMDDALPAVPEGKTWLGLIDTNQPETQFGVDTILDVTETPRA